MSLRAAKQSDGGTATTTTGAVASENESREEIVIVNSDTTNGIYVGVATTPGAAATAVVGKGAYLAPGGGSWTSRFKGAVALISDNATANYTIMEL